MNLEIIFLNQLVLVLALTGKRNKIILPKKEKTKPPIP
jgi:hypothetical protein